MYDLSNPSDVIRQMEDAELTIPAIVKTLKLALAELADLDNKPHDPVMCFDCGQVYPSIKAIQASSGCFTREQHDRAAELV